MGGIGGYLFSKESLGGFNFIDFSFFTLLFILTIDPKYRSHTFFNNKMAKRIFYSLLFFAFYKIIVWGYIVPPSKTIGDFFRYTIVRERHSIFGFLFIIPVYLIAVKNLKSFFNTFVIFSFIALLLTIISSVTSFNILGITQGERYTDSGIIRHISRGYNFLNLSIPIAIIVFFSKLNIQYKNLIYINGAFAVIVVILSLTKNVYLHAFLLLITSLFILYKLRLINISTTINKLIISSFFAIACLLIISPKYLNYSVMLIDDFLSLFVAAEESEISVARINQIPALMSEIREHPFFGTGQGFEQLSKIYDTNVWDATDLPILAHIMQYGLFGIFIYLLVYRNIYLLIKHVIKKIIINKKRFLNSKYKHEIFVIILSVSFLISQVLKGFTIFIELTIGEFTIQIMIMAALLLASFERINLNVYYESKINNNNSRLQ
jgi:hypothetical protein